MIGRVSAVWRGCRRRGLIAVAGLLLAVLWGVFGRPVDLAQGYEIPSEPWVPCSVESSAALAALEASMSPAVGATAVAGSSVTFAGVSGVPLTFDVASTAALLGHTDIDSGSGAPQFGSSPGGSLSYVFASSTAAASVGVVYWSASFSDAGLPECKGQTPIVYTTSPRTLLVEPAPAAVGPQPQPVPGSASTPVRVEVGPLAHARLRHLVVRYPVRCSSSCSGTTAYQVVLERRHGRSVHLPALALSSEPFQISAVAGGETFVTHTYTGHALHLLRSLLHAGATLNLQINVAGTDASGNALTSQRTATLHL